MASVESTEKSVARVQLDYALGKKNVYLDQLTGKEFDEFLVETLQGVNLRELHGFKPLKDLLTFSPGSITYGGSPSHTLAVECLYLISEDVAFSASGFEETFPVSLETHTIGFCCVGKDSRSVFKRNETGEETEDKSVAQSWGGSAYHFKGSGKELAIRRPYNHRSGADQNLIIVSFSYEKVPLKPEHVITELTVEPLLIADFRKYFGDSYARFAREIIVGLWNAISSTADNLEFRTREFRIQERKWEKLSDAVSYIIY